MKKYLAEFFGTFVLVLCGCGTAVMVGGVTGGLAAGFVGDVAIALAFGLSIVAAAYVIGPISGCHVNPAVSLAMLIDGRMNLKDFFGYIIGQVLGALAASGLLCVIVEYSGKLSISKNGLGADGYGAYSAVGAGCGVALITEIILTFIFVMTILGVTANKSTSNIAGLVIGLTLTLVHLIGIPITGTSVNPARSIGPAIWLQGDALSQLWVFILGPCIGAALAALIYRGLISGKTEPEKEAVSDAKAEEKTTAVKAETAAPEQKAPAAKKAAPAKTTSKAPAKTAAKAPAKAPAKRGRPPKAK
jgi:aquaporin Z